ncbi:MAG: pentapeptide repeat-containing protein [Microcoleaceae cyanobacterium]
MEKLSTQSLPAKQPIHWLDLTEYISLGGAVVGTIATAIAKPAIYAAAPLTVALALGAINRQRLKSLQQQDQAEALQNMQSVVSDRFNQVDHSQRNLSDRFSQVETSWQEKFVSHDQKLHQELDKYQSLVDGAIAQLTQELHTLNADSQKQFGRFIPLEDKQVEFTDQLFDLKTVWHRDMRPLEVSLASAHTEIGTIHDRLENLPKPVATDLTPLESEITALKKRLDLQPVQLKGMKLAGIDLQGVYLTQAKMSYAHLEDSDLTKANLRGAVLSGINLNGACLEKADLYDADLSSAKLVNSNLTLANLSYADLTSADLSHSDLSFANLTGGDLSFANLTGANLHGSNLRDSDLNTTILRQANLSNANLNSVDLSDSDLTGANLANSNLTYSNLSGVDLTGANLKGASLLNANLDNAILTDVIIDQNTQIDGKYQHKLGSMNNSPILPIHSINYANQQSQLNQSQLNQNQQIYVYTGKASEIKLKTY